MPNAVEIVNNLQTNHMLRVIESESDTADEKVDDDIDESQVIAYNIAKQQSLQQPELNIQHGYDSSSVNTSLDVNMNNMNNIQHGGYGNNFFNNNGNGYNSGMVDNEFMGGHSIQNVPLKETDQSLKKWNDWRFVF